MGITVDDLSDMMKRDEAARLLGVSITTVDRMIKDGELEAVRIRGSVRISRTACVAALNRTSNLRTRRGRRAS